MNVSKTGPRKRVVIVGGGFGGLQAAKTLANRDLDVVLIDRKNHHTFQPLLYQVAAGVLSPDQIAAPLRQVLRKARNLEVLLDEVTGINLDDRCIRVGDDGLMNYDTLIVAAGASHSYFGHDEWEKIAPGLKTLDDATDIRRRILLAFETAEREQVLTGSHRELNFAIVGGGPTGVELAGVIADIAKRIMASDYKSVDTKKARVMLFEGSDKVLSAFSAESSAKGKTQLEELGVEVRTNNLVKDVEPDRILVGEEWIPITLVLWATGVAASPLGKLLSDKVDRAGRVPVEPDLSIPGHPEVFVIGDMVTIKDAKGQLVPGLGASAMQMGQATAHNILKDLEGKTRCPFTYKDKGTMATIGKHRGVAEIGRIKLSGYIAWVAWGVVHVFLLTTFRNRLFVMSQWIWAYITGQFTSSLITDECHSNEKQ